MRVHSSLDVSSVPMHGVCVRACGMRVCMCACSPETKEVPS